MSVVYVIYVIYIYILYAKLWDVFDMGVHFVEGVREWVGRW